MAKDPGSSIIVNNSSPPSRAAARPPHRPRRLSRKSSSLRPSRSSTDLKNSRERRNPRIVGEGRETLKEERNLPLSPAPSLSLRFSFRPLPPPFLASSKIEIFHPSELICTDWLTSSEFPDRHVNPRGFGAQRGCFMKVPRHEPLTRIDSPVTKANLVPSKFPGGRTPRIKVD